MTTLIIDRKTSIDTLFSFIGAERIEISKNDGERKGQFTAVIDPDDYDNDTDYLCAIPGMKEKILAGMNTPASERLPLEEVWDV